MERFVRGLDRENEKENENECKGVQQRFVLGVVCSRRGVAVVRSPRSSIDPRICLRAHDGRGSEPAASSSFVERRRKRRASTSERSGWETLSRTIRIKRLTIASLVTQPLARGTLKQQGRASRATASTRQADVCVDVGDPTTVLRTWCASSQRPPRSHRKRRRDLNRTSITFENRSTAKFFRVAHHR